MSPHDDQRREHPSTYFVQDRGSEEELTRLQIQDQMITAVSTPGSRGKSMA